VDINAYIESGIIESYVLGLANADEAAELETLAMQHPEIKQAVDDFALLIQKNVTAGSVTPPAELKQQIMDALQDEFEEPKVVIMPVAAPAETNNGGAKVVPITTTGAWRYIGVAAIILLVVSVGLNFYYYNNYKTADAGYQALLNNQQSIQAKNDVYQTKLNSLQSTVSILQDSAMHVVKMAGINKEKAGDVATVYWDTRTKDVYVYVNNLPQAPSGKQYQLWAIVDGKPVDAGMIGACDGVCKMKNIPKAQMFAITLENEGGSPQPHLDQMYVAGKI
jgi:anti-sigma-K factor RskA